MQHHLVQEAAYGLLLRALLPKLPPRTVSLSPYGCSDAHASYCLNFPYCCYCLSTISKHYHPVSSVFAFLMVSFDEQKF